MRALERANSLLRITLNRVRDSVLRRVIGSDMLVITLLTMGVREIQEMRDEKDTHEPVSQ
jgi:hypothetical protein